MTLYSLNGYANGTDIGSVSGITRADGASGELVVNANGYMTVTNSNPSLATMNSGSYSHSITTVVATAGNNNSMLCCVNVVDNNNFHCARFDSGNFQVFQLYAGTFTLLAQAAGSMSNGDSLKLAYDSINDKLTLSKTGVPITGLIDISPVNTLTPSTLVGFHGRQAVTDLVDSFTVDTLAPAYGISDIDDPIPAGSSFNFTAFGTGSISSITSNRAGATLSGITNTSATLSGWVNGGLYPELPSTVQFTFGDGTLTTNANSNISIQSGYTKVSVVSPELSDATYPAAAILAQAGRTIATGDRIYVSEFTKAGGGIDALFTMNPDTWISCDPAGGTFTAWLWVSAGADAGKMYQYDVTVSGSGAITISRRTLKRTLKQSLIGLLKGIL